MAISRGVKSFRYRNENGVHSAVHIKTEIIHINEGEMNVHDVLTTESK